MSLSEQEADGILWAPIPPAKTRVTGVWGARLAPFVLNPGQPGRLPGLHPTSTTTQLRRGYLRGIPPGRWTFTMRNCNQETGKGELWVMYLPPVVEE